MIVMGSDLKAGVDYIGVSAGAVIVNDKREFFLAKRSSGARDDHDKWEFPGGSIKLFETRQQAAIRNVKEKYGVEVSVIKQLGVYDVIDKKSGDHWLSTTYYCEYVAGTPRILQSDKCEEIGWFSLDEVKKLDISRISKLNLKDLNGIIIRDLR